MNTPDYIEITFNDISNEQSDLLVALLSDYGFQGFQEEDKQLKSYISEMNFDSATFADLMRFHQFSFSMFNIQSQNWNAVWEEQFQPVVINDFVGIRAHFHPSFAGQVQYEIIITPKMSFGTGHHATTWMMIEQMQHINFKNKKVLDFGTGTGILAILSEKLGAAHVHAIDIDEWSIENAKENIARNNCCNISLKQADGVVNSTKFDVILANINKNVILNNIPQFVECLNPEGCVLVSGLLAEDESDIVEEINSLHLEHKNTLQKQQWISIFFAR